METIEDLVELEDLSYDPEAIPSELLLYGALLLKGQGVFWNPLGLTEERNTAARRLIPWFAENSHRSLREQSQRLYGEDKVWISDKLPDVCGACFFSFGLCTSGRYRYFGCPECKGKENRIVSWERGLEMHRVCINGDITDAILCQLIYKYYSPNGDRQWELKLYHPLTQ